MELISGVKEGIAVETSCAMPRLSQNFYREVNVLLSSRSTEDERRSVQKEASIEAEDRTDGWMPSLAEWLWDQTGGSRRKVLSTDFIQVYYS